MAPIRRILIVRLSHLGDVVHALPLFHALRDAFPAAEIAWATQAEHVSLLEGLPGLAEAIPFDRHGGLSAWWRLRGRLRAFGADLAVDAQANIKSAFATFFSGATRRAGPARRDWQEPPGALLMTESAPPLGPPGAHALACTAALIRHLVPVPPAELRCDPGLTPEERARGEHLWHQRMPPAARDGGAVILHLARPGDVRSWPPESFARLARLLEDRARPHLLFAGPAEMETGRALERALGASPLRAFRIAREPLRELAGFLTAAAERGALFAGCDSGPLHLAAACSLSVRSLFGPSSFHLTGPWPLPGQGRESPHRVLLAPEPPDCSPCLERRCAHPRGAVCLTDITPEAVLDTLG